MLVPYDCKHLFIEINKFINENPQLKRAALHTEVKLDSDSLKEITVIDDQDYKEMTVQIAEFLEEDSLHGGVFLNLPHLKENEFVSCWKNLSQLSVFPFGYNQREFFVFLAGHESPRLLVNILLILEKTNSAIIIWLKYF